MSAPDSNGVSRTSAPRIVQLGDAPQVHDFAANKHGDFRKFVVGKFRDGIEGMVIGALCETYDSHRDIANESALIANGGGSILLYTGVSLKFLPPFIRNELSEDRVQYGMPPSADDCRPSALLYDYSSSFGLENPELLARVAPALIEYYNLRGFLRA